MADEIDPWEVEEEAFPESGSAVEQARHLVRFAVLAPSSHNAQPWAFRVRPGQIDVHVDESRRLRVADADGRELYLSAGCALENLLVAAEHFGFAPRVEPFPEGAGSSLVARVELARASGAFRSPRPPSLFDAILGRRTDRGEYDTRPIPEGVLDELRGLVGHGGAGLEFIESKTTRRRVDELVTRADALQFSDPEWRRELGFWIGEGAFGTNWLMSKLARLAVRHLDLSKPTARKDRALLDSAPLLAVITVDEVTRPAQVAAGQAFQRLFLGATDAGLALHPMNQVLQLAETRDEFSALLPRSWGVPQMLFRVGYGGEEGPHTPRRSLEEVLVAEPDPGSVR